MTKKLGHFLDFDAEAFLAGKELTAFNAVPLLNDDVQIGLKYTIVVTQDNTDYNDDTTTNIGDSYSVKIIGLKENTINLPAKIKLINPSGKVYGEFRNQLSLSAEAIQTVQKNEIEKKN